MFGSGNYNYGERRKVSLLYEICKNKQSLSYVKVVIIAKHCLQSKTLLQAMRGSSWPWKRGDSDSGISSSEGSSSILRRGRDEETKYREETLSRRRRKEQEEEQLLRGRRSNSLQRRSQEIQERNRDFYNSGGLLGRVRDESLVGRGDDERYEGHAATEWEPLHLG